MDSDVHWMLWLTRDGDMSPVELIGEAVSHYRQKSGLNPNRVLVPEQFPEASFDGVSIERRPNVLPEHLMVAFDPDPLLSPPPPTAPAPPPSPPPPTSSSPAPSPTTPTMTMPTTTAATTPTTKTDRRNNKMEEA